jgi:hypothetical protein
MKGVAEATPFFVAFMSPPIMTRDMTTRIGLMHRGSKENSFLPFYRQAMKIGVWREQYMRTFLERDIPPLDMNIPAKARHRRWQMLPHAQGNSLNLSELIPSPNIYDVGWPQYRDV